MTAMNRALLAKLRQSEEATFATRTERSATLRQRAATGRSKVVVFGGHYHGHIDETLVKAEQFGARDLARENVGAESS